MAYKATMNRALKNVVIAADGGGTGCRAVAGTLTKGVLGRASGGPGNVHSDFEAAIANLRDTITAALNDANLADTPLSHITGHLGLAGISTDEDAQKAADALPYRRITVSGDRETSVRGALGDTDGYLVALGTGTIIARQAALEIRTIGGWGFQLSDQASGAWLGRRLFEEVVLAADGLRPHSDFSRRILEKLGSLMAIVRFAGNAGPADYAAFAPEIVQAAAQEDPIARALMHEGAAYVSKALTALGFEAGDLLVLSGGLGPQYKMYLTPMLSPRIIPAKGTALDGAFDMACDLARRAQ